MENPQKLGNYKASFGLECSSEEKLQHLFLIKKRAESLYIHRNYKTICLKEPIELMYELADMQILTCSFALSQRESPSFLSGTELRWIKTGP